MYIFEYNMYLFEYNMCILIQISNFGKQIETLVLDIWELQCKPHRTIEDIVHYFTNQVARKKEFNQLFKAFILLSQSDICMLVKTLLRDDAEIEEQQNMKYDDGFQIEDGIYGLIDLPRVLQIR